MLPRDLEGNMESRLTGKTRCVHILMHDHLCSPEHALGGLGYKDLSCELSLFCVECSWF